MGNIAKYLLMLESLELPVAISAEKTKNFQHDKERIRKNVAVLEKYIAVEEYDQIIKNVSNLRLDDGSQSGFACSNEAESYCYYVEHILAQLMNSINFSSDEREDLISTRHLNLCISVAQDLSFYALNQQLHPLLRSKGLFGTQTNVVEPFGHAHLQNSLELFSRILKIKQFHSANLLTNVLRDYIGAIFTLFIAHSLSEISLSGDTLLQLEEKLNALWAEVTKTEYFRNILMLKGCTQLPSDVQRRLHQELLQKLVSPDGFTTLVTTLFTAAQHSEQSGEHNSKQTFNIIANIVAFKGHSKRFQKNMLDQITKFLKLCLVHEKPAILESMGAGLLAMRRLYDLNDENQKYINNWLRSSVMPLTHPSDLISGLVLMEHQQFCLITSQLFHLFCTSSIECLPSELLVQFIPFLLQLYDALPPSMIERHHVSQLIIRCLANRSAVQLHELMGKLYNQQFDNDWLQLHKRVLLQPNAEQTVLNLKISPMDYRVDFSISIALPELLLSGEHNILTYQVFMSLLRHMDACLWENSEAGRIELLQTQQDLIAFLNSKYPVKVDFLLSLNTLVSHDGLKTQLAENATDFLKLLKELLGKRINAAQKSQFEAADQTLLIMLTLAQEILEYTQRPEPWLDFSGPLKQLQSKTPNQLIKQRIECLITLLNGDTNADGSFKAHQVAQSSRTPFGEARSLIESSESHLQVYGIQTLLDLLRRRDVVTLANTHVIIALALSTLRNKESYTFLNCVRLFVALLDVVEAEVLELLTDEYLNEQESLDHRLVIGEAILKVSKELGPLSYNYKDVLLNCFVHGARSQIDEFRWSSFSNLSQLCRTLSYQVHTYFNELITLIDCELRTGKYLPAKRAAVLVISELLEGMENILDFEEMLLPVYRVLKDLEANENHDEKMRLHAANGLRALGQKCKKFLFPQRKMQQTIKIDGIQKGCVKIKPLIVEMN